MSLSASSDVADLVRQAQAGSEEASELLYERYREPLLKAIRELLRPPLRRLYDSDDFLLLTFEEMFTRHFTEKVLCSPRSLWLYLQRIAQNKVRDARRKYLLTQRFNINRDVPLDSVSLTELSSADLSPEEALLLKELVEDRLTELREQLPSMLRGMIQLVLQGHNGQQIAHRLNVEPKRVYRAMAWLERKLLQE